MFASPPIHISVVILASFTLAGAARADTANAGNAGNAGNAPAAETLFRSGKELLARKDYAHACPTLAQSYRLDPATGTLLALAICHEREGKRATARTEYANVAARSKGESRPDREAAARGKVAELETEVSTLTLVVSDAAAAVVGVEIKCNGVVIAPAWFGTPIPVDGGTISIDASAPGKKPRHIELTVDPRGDRQTVTIAPFDEVEPTLPVPISLPKPLTEERGAAPAVRSGSGLRPVQVAGIVASVCGGVSLGLAAFFAFEAVDKNNASGAECIGDLCTPAGKQDRSDALSSGNLATAAVIGGGALVTVGAALYFLGHGGREGSAGANATSLRVLPTSEGHGFGGLLQGGF